MMEPIVIGDATLHLGDCLDVMRGMPDCSIDAIVTDPPYALTANKKGGSGKASLNTKSPAGRSRIGTGGGFMGKAWDSALPTVAVWAEALRVAKPGAHLLAFGGTRTFHRLACAIEDAGWEIRDTVMWVYGSGFPKSLNLRDVRPGWGTALKPAWEPIIVARKPLEGPVAANVLKHGVGGLNIDGCRVAAAAGDEVLTFEREAGSRSRDNYRTGTVAKAKESGLGRFPTNLIHDGSDEVVGLFPEANSARASGNPNNPRHGSKGRVATSYDWNPERESHDYRDTGSAARFFYCAKASRSDRGEGNTHPTVKPTTLMRYLCRLVTPPNGIVLDPFMGSGSTGKAAMLGGFCFIGIDREAEYLDIARARIAAAIPEPVSEPEEQQMSLAI
jgi:site-specific DNA-methyltransferase (adenine-specific)